ncbi:Hypothetical protein PFREUD_21780 [Propionibacterium freudenreichii subsp. shermanii CIRM-BIA1]|uniref:Uncharacterized protein n=1 Tax=Propionibacterium freudenreichii subsp. shermanii (strain ATCC 9614 / DSM 4902 / CIP 103027 / NCIMB 8099 / CIRM-BIA1) TaxID=754252 RepID=D7GGL9_PROFC|nr:Hypothetical protein PFREUD_21780 [Propionibacterium freudenreichii subsp. shermanii CIRM-BIA1]
MGLIVRPTDPADPTDSTGPTALPAMMRRETHHEHFPGQLRAGPWATGRGRVLEGQ